MDKRFFLLPLKAIREEPYLFVLWVLSAAGLGLMGFWFPLIFLPSDQIKVTDVLQRLVCAGVLPSFGVVFISSAMAEALVGTKSYFDVPTQTVLSQVRVITVVVSLAAILSQSALLSKSLSGGGYQRDGVLQVVLVVASLLLGVYLYCFRHVFGESVVSHMSEENAETKHLGETAKTADQDSSGNKL